MMPSKLLQYAVVAHVSHEDIAGTIGRDPEAVGEWEVAGALVEGPVGKRSALVGEVSIYVMNENGPDRKVVFAPVDREEVDGWPTWSSDGKRNGLISPGQMSGGAGTIWTIPSAGYGRPREVSKGN